jgi:signal transduction histidine kinase
MRQKHGLTVRVTAADEGPVAGDGEPLRMLFNVVRELLFNVTKHAQVTVAIVQVQRVGDQIRIVVEDKGTGTAAFQSNTMGAADVGLGLFNIRKRLDLVGGRFEIDSAPGKGSRFTLEAPWDQAHRGRRGVARCERAACATTVSWRKRT